MARRAPGRPRRPRPRTPLGRTEAAGALRPHLRAVAADDQGLLTQLRRLRETLAQAERGIRAAMADYQSVDALNAAGLR
ncbi:hypothetical protein ACFQV2_37270 [Actinokineospora soli]|uniref:Excreted virulence factor EspC, type VII ESX diderm n=1 Tax=Actinokineospora soli TaxID=1048753 RepID=A0ABW2TY94_9PSEU